MIPNTNPNLCATYDWTNSDTSARNRVYVPVIAWDHEGYALIPGIGGRLVRAVESSAAMGRFAGLNGYLDHIEPWAALQARGTAAADARRPDRS